MCGFFRQPTITIDRDMVKLKKKQSMSISISLIIIGQGLKSSVIICLESVREGEVLVNTHATRSQPVVPASCPSLPGHQATR